MLVEKETSLNLGDSTLGRWGIASSDHLHGAGQRTKVILVCLFGCTGSSLCCRGLAAPKDMGIFVP